jgi:methylated-DNA-[protein]-cysteine S-methyltransferase
VITPTDGIYIINTPIGRLGLAEDKAGGKLARVYFENEIEQEGIKDASEFLRDAHKQIDEYFSGVRQVFDIPPGVRGTVFQCSVWEKLAEIPFGETRTYKEIAQNAGNPKAARAVGMANNKNPLPLIVPCHRVLGSGGSLTGFRGGIEVKKKLLEHERTIYNIRRVY